MKKIDSIYLKLGLLIILIVGGMVHINRLRSSIKYVDFDCPRCGYCEVLDLGENINGETEAKCPDCGVEFSFTDICE